MKYLGCTSESYPRAREKKAVPSRIHALWSFSDWTQLPAKRDTPRFCAHVESSQPTSLSWYHGWSKILRKTTKVVVHFGNGVVGREHLRLTFPTLQIQIMEAFTQSEQAFQQAFHDKCNMWWECARKEDRGLDRGPGKKCHTKPKKSERIQYNQSKLSMWVSVGKWNIIQHIHLVMFAWQKTGRIAR